MIIKEIKKIEEFKDGDVLLIDDLEEKTYLLNDTAKIVYTAILNNVNENYEETFAIIKKQYNDFPKAYYEETIKHFKAVGLMDEKL